MKILHIATDEKFIDSAINQFTWYENVDSDFFICCPQNEVKYIHSTASNVRFFDSAAELVSAANAMNADFVLLHSFGISYVELLKLKHRIIWKLWGYDFYSDKYDCIQRAVSLNLYGPRTRAQTTSFKMKCKHYLRVLARMFGVKSVKQKLYDALVSKVEFLAPIFDEEFEMAKKKYPHLKYCPFQYYSGGKSNSEFKNVFFEQPYNIFIGNSLDPSNNHLDILAGLDKLKQPVNVIMPISYSGNPKYKDYLKKQCAKFKNVSVRFLETFMERSEYFKLASTCPFAIYGHRRQQAASNIAQMLKDGVKVFLYKDSVNYRYYSNCGYKVFSIDEDLNFENLKEPLAAEFVRQNQEVYVKYENIETYAETMKKFLERGL